MTPWKITSVRRNRNLILFSWLPVLQHPDSERFHVDWEPTDDLWDRSKKGLWRAYPNNWSKSQRGSHSRHIGDGLDDIAEIRHNQIKGLIPRSRMAHAHYLLLQNPIWHFSRPAKRLVDEFHKPCNQRRTTSTIRRNKINKYSEHFQDSSICVWVSWAARSREVVLESQELSRNVVDIYESEALCANTEQQLIGTAAGDWKKINWKNETNNRKQPANNITVCDQNHKKCLKSPSILSYLLVILILHDRDELSGCVVDRELYIRPGNIFMDHAAPSRWIVYLHANLLN